jgi:hypothetical protein
MLVALNWKTEEKERKGLEKWNSFNDPEYIPKESSHIVHGIQK